MVLLLFPACEANGDIWIICWYENAQSESCYCSHVLLQICIFEIFFLTWNTVTVAQSRESKFFLSGKVSPLSCRKPNLQPNRCIPKILHRTHTKHKKLINQKHINYSISQTNQIDNNCTQCMDLRVTEFEGHIIKNRTFLTKTGGSSTIANASGFLHILLVTLCNLLP